MTSIDATLLNKLLVLLVELIEAQKRLLADTYPQLLAPHSGAKYPHGRPTISGIAVSNFAGAHAVSLKNSSGLAVATVPVCIAGTLGSGSGSGPCTASGEGIATPFTLQPLADIPPGNYTLILGRTDTGHNDLPDQISIIITGGSGSGSGSGMKTGSGMGTGTGC